MTPQKNPSSRSPQILVLHKPKGFEVTRPSGGLQDSAQYSNTVYSLLTPNHYSQGWVPVGRLDKDSSGMLLFVQEGFLVRRLQTPQNLDKVYEVWVKGHLKNEHLEKLEKGILTSIGRLKAKRVRILGYLGSNTLVEVVLDEGKNRHIRRLLGALKDTPKNKFFKVLDLTRVSMGTLSLDLEPGQWRYLSETETEKMLNFKK